MDLSSIRKVESTGSQTVQGNHHQQIIRGVPHAQMDPRSPRLERISVHIQYSHP